MNTVTRRGRFSSQKRRYRHGTFFSGAAECRADAIFRHADLPADFLVVLAFQVIHANDVSLRAVEPLEQAFDLFSSCSRSSGPGSRSNGWVASECVSISEALVLRFNNSRTTMRRAITVR